MLLGIPRKPWTKLAATANAGDTEIVLEQPVDWKAGDHIVIASTGLRHSQRENEEVEILAVSLSLEECFLLLEKGSVQLKGHALVYEHEMHEL